MNKIIYPNNFDDKFYDKTIQTNPNIILDGFYYGQRDEEYAKSRVELVSSFKLTYHCDFWLDGFCWQDYNSFYHVPDTRILELIEKYYNISIPLGCLSIAVKHRKEKHKMAPDGIGFDLIFRKKAFFDYLELYDK